MREYDEHYAHTLIAMLNGLTGVKVIDILLSSSRVIPSLVEVRLRP